MTSRLSASEANAQFAAARPRAMSGALTEALTWCVAPSASVGRGRRSDQYWLQLLAVEPARVDRDRIHEFLASFQLAMKRTWDKPRVAERVRILSSEVVRTVPELVQSLAADLQGCILSKNASEQTSAASKFIFFARPNDDVFIWDRLARISAAFRERVRQGRPISSNSLRKHFLGGSDYPRYHLACASIWHEERERSDFQIAVDTFGAFLRGTGGPMMEGQIATQRFIERRLLDKLMFCEGQILETMFKSDPPAA